MLGRLAAEGAKCLVIAAIIVLLSLVFGVSIASGLFGFVLLIVLTALWGVVYAGFMQCIALKTRSAAATNSGGLIFFPLLFLTPNLVPRDLLTDPMEVAASLNPVTYLMEALRSLILDDLAWGTILPGFAVVFALGARDAHAQRADDQQLRLIASALAAALARASPARASACGRAPSSSRRPARPSRRRPPGRRRGRTRSCA